MKRRVPITVVHALSAAHGEVGGNSQAGPYEGDHLGKQFFRIAGAAGYTCLPPLSRDGLRLYFSSTRPRPLPGGGVTTDFDMWVSERTDRRDPLGWAPPVNLGIGFNTNGGQELGPVPFEDPLTETFTLYFYAIRPETGARDLFTSTLGEDGLFHPHPIAELNTKCNDEQPSIRRDGLELFFTSNRD